MPVFGPVSTSLYLSSVPSLVEILIGSCSVSPMVSTALESKLWSGATMVMWTVSVQLNTFFSKRDKAAILSVMGGRRGGLHVGIIMAVPGRGLQVLPRVPVRAGRFEGQRRRQQKKQGRRRREERGRRLGPDAAALLSPPS